MYVRNNLYNMRSVRIQVADENHSKHQGLAAWFPYMPALRELRTTGQLNNGTDVFNGWRLPTHAPLPKLHTLLLEDLQLSETADDIVNILDLHCLQTLTISRCSNTRPLLRPFARSFRRTKNLSLTAYTHEGDRLTEDDCEATEELFESVNCLVSLICTATEEGRLPRLSSLHNNAKTLKELYLCTAESSQLYSIRDPGHVPTYFPNLEYLGLTIGDLSQRVDDVLGSREPFDILSDQNYVNALVRLECYNSRYGHYSLIASSGGTRTNVEASKPRHQGSPLLAGRRLQFARASVAICSDSRANPGMSC